MDPIEILLNLNKEHADELRNIARTQGDISRQLKQGEAVHRQLISATGRLHGRVSSLERKVRRNREKTTERTSLLAEMTELLKAAKPYLFFLACVAFAVVKITTGSTEPLWKLLEHFAIKE